MSADALKLTSYFGERDRSGHRLVADALLALYGERAINTSVLIRGIGGFGVRHALRTDRLLSSSEDLPVVSVALDTRARIEAVLPGRPRDRARRAIDDRAGAVRVRPVDG